MDSLAFLERGGRGEPLPVYVLHGDEDFLKRRVEEASRYIDLDQLAISPKCGFSMGVFADKDRSIQLEQEKLGLVVAAADAIWGSHGAVHA